VVPSGAENGAILPASSALQIAPDCTEMANGEESLNGLNDLKNSEENGASCACLHQHESNCIDQCARGESNSHPLRDWILSPARRSRKGRSKQELRNHAPVEVPTLVPSKSHSRSSARLSPEISQIIDAWPSLPPVAKAGILAMIEAADSASLG
jgi:hypothetical protein